MPSIPSGSLMAPSLSDREFLLALADMLASAKRMGALLDEPEGVCYVAFSDTLLIRIERRLRSIVEGIPNAAT